MKKEQTKTKYNFTIKQNVCFRCGRKIDLDLNYLKLITMNESKVIEEVWFHLPLCWQEYNDFRFQHRLQEHLTFGTKLINQMITN